ncbi:MAG TPA: ribonuclease III [Dehalococcoidia bacterium]|nr:ribonuclease III [Dehalococcoidia bacterium]
MPLPTIPLDSEQLDAVEEALNATFNDRSLLTLALTHQSYVNEHPDVPPVSNERLEFLGDSIVGMIVADRMFTGAPDLPEGDLTVRRSQVVRRETLAKAARKIGLGEWLVMGKGEATAGGADRASNLADTFEAVVGALYIDRGYRQARTLVNRWLGEHVDEALRTETQKDPKSLLQEYLQGNGSKPPRYRLVSETGTPSDLVFTMEVVIDSKPIATGSGSRKVDAEREAANRALNRLKTK